MTKIEWSEQSWDPVAGCSLVSPGCTNCYAMKQAARILNLNYGSHYKGTVQGLSGSKPTWTGKIVVAPDHIFNAPLKRHKPTLWFVNSMSDLFHEGVDDATIDRVFAIMALSPQHTFQVLTKRHERMREYCKSIQPLGGKPWDRITELAVDIGHQHRGHRGSGGLVDRPLPNVWLGVSVEDQRRADERIPVLIETPAAVRFLSVEPMLGPVTFVSEYKGSKLDWVICGGESGPGARLFNLAWARDLRDHCARDGIAFFMKQMGSKPVGNSFPFAHSKGGDMTEWPEDLRVRQMPVAA